MKTVKCTYSNGDTITTKMNATLKEIKDHYLGNMFNIGTVNDNIQQCIKVDLITETNNPWVWTKLTETLKPDRKEGSSVPIEYMMKGVNEWRPYKAWIDKGYVQRVQIN